MTRILYPIVQAPVLTTSQTPEGVTESRWHQPFSEPKRFRIAPALCIALAASGCFYTTPPTFAEQVTESRWHQPFSEPQRSRALPTNEHAAAFFVRVVAPTETITVDKWFINFTEQQRFRRNLPAYLQKFEVDDSKGWTVPESVTESRWHEAFTDPLFLKFRQFQRQLYGPSFLVDTKGLTNAETVTESRWHQPFSEPNWRSVNDLNRRRAFEVVSGLYPGIIKTIEPTVDSWFRITNEWPRLRPHLRAALQHSFEFDVRYDPQRSVATFYEALSEPRRFPLRVQAGSNLFQAYVNLGGETITEGVTLALPAQYARLDHNFLQQEDEPSGDLIVTPPSNSTVTNTPTNIKSLFQRFRRY